MREKIPMYHFIFTDLLLFGSYLLIHDDIEIQVLYLLSK